jgi:Ca-activated chloride channel family protein
MTFQHPVRLVLLLIAVAALVGAYVVLQVVRRRDARRFANPALLPLVAPSRAGWWRHATAALFVVVAATASVGAAQPTIPGQTTRESATIILAVDTSDSMGATDVAPNRIKAAVAAAKDFISNLPAGFDVGVVTAGSLPAVVASPTTDHQQVMSVLDGLTLSPGTALGDAITTALAAFPSASQGTRSDGAQIVLLSDGITTTGRPDQVAIDAAAAAKIPVSTIAFGTASASVVSQGQTVSVPVDSSALRKIAQGTGGRFFQAATSTQLRSIYDTMHTRVTVVTTDRDIAEWFAAGALALLVLAVLLSMATTARPAWA